jgi:hypothetical protein
MDGFRRVESSQTPARGPQFGPNVQPPMKRASVDISTTPDVFFYEICVDTYQHSSFIKCKKADFGNFEILSPKGTYQIPIQNEKLNFCSKISIVEQSK